MPISITVRKDLGHFQWENVILLWRLCKVVVGVPSSRLPCVCGMSAHIRTLHTHRGSGSWYDKIPYILIALQWFEILSLQHHEHVHCPFASAAHICKHSALYKEVLSEQPQIKSERT